MKTQPNGIGNYKRKRSTQYALPITDEQRARMDAADKICRERAASQKIETTGVPSQRVEATT